MVNDTSQHDIQRLIEDNIAKATRDLNGRFASMKMNIAADCSTAGASLERQQQDCYREVVEKSNEGTKLLLRLLGFLRYGDANSARMVADYAQQGFEPRDFTCERSAGKSKCMFNPYVHELNVLPNEVELVIATEEEATWNRRMLIELIDVALQNASSSEFPVPARASCDDRRGQSSGYVTEGRFGSAAVTSTPPAGFACP